MQEDPRGAWQLHGAGSLQARVRAANRKTAGDVPLPKTTEPPPRIQIQAVRPQIDCGRYPVKRTVGDSVAVSARIFRDGHDVLGAAVRYKPPGAARWLRGAARRRSATTCGRAPSRSTGRDGGASASRPGSTGSRRTRASCGAGCEGGQDGPERRARRGRALLGRPSLTVEEALAATAGDRARQDVVGDARGRRRPRARPLRRLVRALPALVRRVRRRRAHVLPRARRARLRRRLPPADPPDRPHEPQGPQQRARRPGRTIPAARGRSAPPKAATTRSHPELGTLADFDRLVARAHELGLEIALDFAIQCSPDHPWLTRAPRVVPPPPGRHDQVRREPAEALPGHRQRQLRVRGLEGPLDGAARRRRCSGSRTASRVFRVDNPHTKPLPFWEWLIAEVRARAPRGASSSPRRSRGPR